MIDGSQREPVLSILHPHRKIAIELPGSILLRPP